MGQQRRGKCCPCTGSSLGVRTVSIVSGVLPLTANASQRLPALHLRQPLVCGIFTDTANFLRNECQYTGYHDNHHGVETKSKDAACHGFVPGFEPLAAVAAEGEAVVLPLQMALLKQNQQIVGIKLGRLSCRKKTLG